MKQHLLLLFISLTLYTPLSAIPRQHTENLNSWFMYFGDHKFSRKFGVHLEAQFRRKLNVFDPQQLLLRTGLNYNILPNTFITAGYCFVETFPYGGQPVKARFPEHRLWEQLQVKSTLGKTEWISRFRLEQRFSHPPVADSSGKAYVAGDAVYTNRFRLLNRFSLPIQGKVIADKSVYLTTYAEFFFNFGQNVSYNLFDQLRLYGAIGYKIPQVGRMELGYMEQTIAKNDGIHIENNHTMQLGLISNLDLFKKHKAN